MEMELLRGILIPFVGTSAGAACVFFMKKELGRGVQRALTGFAAGVMVAASVWSLLIPAMEQSEHMGSLAFLPAAVGFWAGVLFLLLLDHLIPHLHMHSQSAEGPRSRLARTTMMVLAVTLHNIPEGMAVGVVYAGWRAGNAEISAGGALALALGIAIQNFPEGALRISGRETDAVFFHKPEEPHGHLSNWYPSPFDLDGIRFSSVEQYVMYRKCMLFGDETSAKAVLATNDTAAQQALGRKASGYIGSVWAGMRQMVAFRGLMAKFSQNEDLKQKLLDTGDAYLVECAGSDKVWACGLRLNDDRRFDAANWTGENILGFALMEVREAMKRMK